MLGPLCEGLDHACQVGIDSSVPLQQILLYCLDHRKPSGDTGETVSQSGRVCVLLKSFGLALTMSAFTGHDGFLQSFKLCIRPFLHCPLK